MAEQISVGELLKEAPRNWGKWGHDDEVGSLNYLTPEVVVAAAGSIKSGKVFTLQVKMANPEGDPVWPGRTGCGAHDGDRRGPLPRRQGRALLRRRALRRRLHDLLPAGQHAVRRARARLVRRPDLERLRRQDDDRRPGQGQRLRHRREGRRRPRDPAGHRQVAGQGVPRRRRDVHPRGPHGVRQGPGRGDPEERHPDHPHRVDRQVLQGQPRGVLRQLRRARPDLQPRAGPVVPRHGDPQPRHRHDRQRGHRRSRSPA